MTKKIRLLLIAVFAFIACVCLFAGCNLKPSLDDILDDLDKKGAVVNVTYFANEGSFDGNTNIRVKTLRYKPGSTAMDLGHIKFVSGKITIERTYYELEGWCEAELDEDGNPVCIDGSSYEFSYDGSTFGKAEGATSEDPFDPDKFIKIGSEEFFDFENEVLEKDRHYFLVAKWKKVPAIRVMLAGEVESISIEVASDDSDESEDSQETKEPVIVKNGEELTRIRYTSDRINKPAYDPVSGVLDGSFIEFYSDSTCMQEFTGWPVMLSDHEDEDVENPFTIYARYIEGLWSVVKKPDQVVEMFDGALFAENRFFIFGEIDCKDVSIEHRTAAMGFGCEIIGDEGKIVNLKINSTLSTNVNGASLLGEIKSTAKIKNLVIENIEATYTVSENTKVTRGIYFAFTSIATGAEIAGVKLSGKMTVTINNMTDKTLVPNLSDGIANHWKFGGYKEEDAGEFNYYDSDASYTGGITVDAEIDLTINQAN